LRRPSLIVLALLVGAAIGAALADDAAPARTPAALSGTLRDSKGKPIANAAISVEGGATAKTAADGTWTISPVAPGDALVTAKAPGVRVQALLRVAAGESRRWDATIGRPGLLQGRVVDEYGNPLARLPGWEKGKGWRVFAEPEQAWMNEPHSETWGCLPDENGNFRLRVSPDALFRLRVWRTDWQALTLRTEWMSAGLSDITLRVLPADMPHARLFCRLEDFNGTAVTGDGAPGKWVSLRRADEDSRGYREIGGRLAFDSAKGAWVSNPLAPGSYGVVTYVSDRGAVEFPEVEVRDAADVDIGTLRLTRPGRVRFVAERSGPESDAPIRVDLRCVRRFEESPGPIHRWWWWGGARGPDLTGDAPAEQGLYPGRWYATLSPIDPVRSKFVYAEIPFEVRAGETTSVTIPVRGAPLRWIRVGFAGRTPSQAIVAVSDASGVVVGRSWVLHEGRQEFQTCLAPGRHTLVALTSDRRRLTGTLDIPAENAPEKFDVVLR
jgi:hypothetical protein